VKLSFQQGSGVVVGCEIESHWCGVHDTVRTVGYEIPNQPSHKDHPDILFPIPHTIIVATAGVLSSAQS
jgi:hypothetical protein